MANLIAKKLSQLPIGTNVELTYLYGGTQAEKKAGVITDSDFSSSIELTSGNNEENILDFSLIRSVLITKPIELILLELLPNTHIIFSYGLNENRKPNLSGKVIDNDHEAYIEIETSAGKSLTLNYSEITSLLIKGTLRQSSGITIPNSQTNKSAQSDQQSVKIGRSLNEHLYEKTPEDIINVSDAVLRQTFDSMSKDERKKLSSSFDSFKYGAKNNDRNKMISAAKQAKQILLYDDGSDYQWSTSASLFCGYLLRRCNVFDHEVFLIGGHFHEAAVSCLRENEFVLAGAYAILALLDSKAEYIDDLLIILATSIVKTEDVSGLKVLKDCMPDDFSSSLDRLVADMFSAKGISISSNQSMDSSLKLLNTLYPNSDIAEEVTYWISDSDPNANNTEPSSPIIIVEQETPKVPEAYHGVISRLNWMQHTGVIKANDGTSYTFAYADISDPYLMKSIGECLRADLDGAVYSVKFTADGGTAKQIQTDDALVDQARSIVADVSRTDRFEKAFALCKMALDTNDAQRAITDIIKYSITIYSSNHQIEYIDEAIDLYEKHSDSYPSNTFALIDLARCYAYAKKYPQMLESAEKAVAFSGLTLMQRMGLLANFFGLARNYYDVSKDKAVLSRMLDLIEDLKVTYGSGFLREQKARWYYDTAILPHRIFAECWLDMLEEAEADFENLSDQNTRKKELAELLQATHERVTPATVTVAESSNQVTADNEPHVESSYTYGDDFTEEDETDEDILPYTDIDGWATLNLSKKDVIEYALSITGSERLPAVLAYLRAGAQLCDEIAPLYNIIALAVNDPTIAPEYGVTSVMNALANGDPDYPELNDYCIGAAFLRTAFFSDTSYDYNVRNLRDSISISKLIPALDQAYEILDQFQKETGRPIDIYANYRNHGAKKLKDELEANTQHAQELYTKFILSPVRENVKFARLLETKKIVFSKDGVLATYLHWIIDQDTEAMEAGKSKFVSMFLDNSAHLASNHINNQSVDELIANAWDIAGRNMPIKRNSSILQGNRRNNLRSSISEILNTICQWYYLSEQNAGLNWKTESGESSYQRLSSQLLEQLEKIQQTCAAGMEISDNVQSAQGLFILSSVADELSQRIRGTWRFGQEKYMYADFLRSNWITLDKDFVPDLSSTFCALPEFNVLARIRKHVEGTKLSLQEQIVHIYGTDKTCNNYGTADRIAEYVDAVGSDNSISLPDGRDKYVSRTEMQVEMRYRSFRETYALAINYGQIIKSDNFCSSLEDTVRYWYARSRETKNYGFFISLLLHAENQIHASARQYEEQLDEHLDALIAKNKSYFDAHPDYAEAIRGQIVNQNFTVAEDWMARIRIGDFSLDVQEPEALGYLDAFWNSFVVTYNRVADASRSLSSLLGRREVRNKDGKRAQQLIDNWMSNGNHSNPERIEQLLNLLGWQNISVTQYELAGETRVELYEVKKESGVAGLTTPLHPIAAFGSGLDKKHMYVACLFGNYDSDRLFVTMRALDNIDGNKIILLDYALGQTDRRAMARKLKQRESGLRNMYLVIDRVLITYLANNYNENLINRILMATAVPFSYCQPYVVESVHTMPPEIFIGRKDELLKIEQPEGVNLIYGGRQLGKSALFKKALSDLDGRQQQRAVLVDIKELDCAAAAKKVSSKLIDLNITPDAEITDDWDILCRNIERRIRRTDDEISYFLLMLDEADVFIGDCANCGYRPLVALKDVQQSFPGRFKYVLAGLHNIVRFNRQVALGNNSVITHMPSLKITPFHTPEAEELLTMPLSYLGFSLPSKVTVSQILATCNYFPGLIQLYAKKLIESIRAADYAGYDIKRTPPYVVSDAHLRRVMSDKEFVEQIHEKFEITLTLDQDQGSCYYPLTLLIGWMYSDAPSKNGYTAKDVLNYARDLSVLPIAILDEEKIDALLMELQDLNILRSVSNNSYLLASKNFRDLLGSEEEILDKLVKVGGSSV